MILSFCGAISGGKSTACRLLKENFDDYKEYCFANALKEECSQHLSREELGWNGKDWSGPKTEQGRKFLQTYAEEKRKTNPDHWLRIVETQIQQDNPKFALISDSRYCNELDWVSHHGKVCYIHNMEKERQFIEDYKSGKNIHASEFEWRFWLLSHRPNKDYTVIDNNGSLEMLEAQMRGLDYNLHIEKLLGHKDRI